MREQERLRNSSRLQEIILGNQWLKLTWVVWQQEVPVRKKVLPLRTNQENSGGAQRRVEKPIHMSHQPPEILAGIHLGWEVARTTRKYAESDQIWAQARWLPRDNPETTHNHKTWDCGPQGRAVILGSCTTLLLSVQAPLPNKVFFFFYFVSTVSPRTIHFWVFDKHLLSRPGKGPPSCSILTQIVWNYPAWEICFFRLRRCGFNPCVRKIP